MWKPRSFTYLGRYLQAPTSAKRENTGKLTIKCIKYYYPDMPLTRKAHKSEETGAPRKMHLRIQVRAHMSASTRKIHPGEGHLGLADPRVWPNLD